MISVNPRDILTRTILKQDKTNGNMMVPTDVPLYIYDSKLQIGKINKREEGRLQDSRIFYANICNCFHNCSI